MSAMVGIEDCEGEMLGGRECVYGMIGSLVGLDLGLIGLGWTWV